MTRWADRFLVQQQLEEMNFDKPAFMQHPALLGIQPESPEHKQFDSAQEDAGEEEGNTTSALDTKLDASTGKETDTSGHLDWVPLAERCRRRNHAMQREHTQVQREFQRPKNRHLSFPLFRETTKEDTISYRDWRSEIEDALEQGHNAAKVKEAMFASLEGMARHNTKMIDENGDLHVMRILDGLDSLYGVSMTFQSLNAALCSLQQKQMESTRAYYNCMVQITVILSECHGNCYRPGELARMSKDCFYAGFLPENHPMVVHLKDQPHTTPLDPLRALLEQEENNALTRTQYIHPVEPATEAGGVLLTMSMGEKSEKSNNLQTGQNTSGNTSILKGSYTQIMVNPTQLSEHEFTNWMEKLMEVCKNRQERKERPY